MTKAFSLSPLQILTAISCALGVSSVAAQETRVELIPDPAMACRDCADWNRPQTPFRIFGNTYYVGPAGLSSILIVSDDGLILLDGGLTQSAPLIAQNIAQLGFELARLRLIVTSHTHHDHVGGVAALVRATGARVAASGPSADALRSGAPNLDDPQYDVPENRFPPVREVQVVADGEALRIGDVALTAHMTPGHTLGGTTWTWKSCEGERCLDVVYADSLTAVSADGFRFTDSPDRVEQFRASIDLVAALPCDILLAPHPGFVQLDAKLKAWTAHPDKNPFVGTGACSAYASAARSRLATRLATEARDTQP
jgi:metallo-beta-lactamase class B